MIRTGSRPPRVLITDDEQDMRWMLSVLMKNEGFAPLEAADGPAAVRAIHQGLADVMLLDLRMPGTDGLEVLREARQLPHHVPVIVLTGHGTSESAVEAGRHGAHGFLTKPFKNDELVFTVRMVLESVRAEREGRSIGQGSCLPLSSASILGPSEPMQRVLREVQRVAPTDFTVVITGETGVGKEVVANLIHRHSPRAAGPFVPVDCGAIPATLIESELFGHEKGAFTGADRSRAGSFEVAAGGTLFLDEIGNLPLPMQAKLLRALQERQVQRVGGRVPLRLEARVLVATNEDLSAMVKTGRFRQDLYFRLNEYNIRIPPLRDREQDVACLAQQFLECTCTELNKDVQGFSDSALERLEAHRWPGNVRELRNVVRRAVLLADAVIGPEHLCLGSMASLPAGPTSAAHALVASGSFKEIVRRSTMEVEREVLIRVLKETGGNMAHAARVLQIDYKTVRTKAKQYHLSHLD